MSMVASITPTDRTFRVHHVPGSLSHDPRTEIHKRNGRYYRDDYLGNACVGSNPILVADAKRFVRSSRLAECIVEAPDTWR